MSDFLKQSFQDALTSFNRYEGSGAYFTLFFIAMIIIFFYGRESKKAGSRDSYDTRIIFALYFPLLAFLMIINPLIAGPIMIGIDSFVYWRAFWIIPITIIIAIAMAIFVMKVPRGSQRRLAVIACVAVIAVSGSLIYNAENYKKAENIYKLPEEAIAICLMIRADTPDYASVAVPTALSPIFVNMTHQFICPTADQPTVSTPMSLVVCNPAHRIWNPSSHILTSIK